MVIADHRFPKRAIILPKRVITFPERTETADHANETRWPLRLGGGVAHVINDGR
ncbi:unnamed protein product (plasmid) [Mycetohabitans rhizoxinica HKI 454]|nr:unnamed protein product [Mycetohabitans rhizoxinica HKI 454]